MTDLLVTTKEHASALTGLAVDRIGTVRLELDMLREQGILVTLNISGTGMFSRMAEWSEIGIAEDDIRASRLTRGSKHLIPEEVIKRLKSVETSMRNALDDLSYDVTGFRPFRWVPFTAYSRWIARWTELTERFYAIKSEILTNYDNYIDRLADDFAEVAEASWKSIRAQGYDWAIVDGKAYGDLVEFQQVIVSRAVSRVPSIERVERDLTADYRTNVVYGQEDIAADEARAAGIRAEVGEARRVDQMQSYLLEEQYRHDQVMNNLAEDARRSQIEAMRQAELDHARQQLNEIASPFAEVFSSLRFQIAQDATEMLDSIKKNGYVRGKVASRGLGLLETFDLLAVHNDAQLRARLVELKSLIGGVGAERAEDAQRDTGAVIAALEQIRDLTHASAKDLMSGPSRFSLAD